jgi:hypothetical protein
MFKSWFICKLLGKKYYYLKLNGLGYRWTDSPIHSTAFTSVNSASDYMDCMSEENVFIAKRIIDLGVY